LYNSNCLTIKARAFAVAAHSAVEQKQKYTHEPYHMHCSEVAAIVSIAEGVTSEMIAAAYLHDVVEDTPIGIELITEEFGSEVSSLVWWLTDKSKPEDGNREERKRIDRLHIANAPAQAKTIKLADLISNTASIVEYDRNFARVYLKEKLLLLEVLKEGDKTLYNYAKELADKSIKSLA